MNSTLSLASSCGQIERDPKSIHITPGQNRTNRMSDKMLPPRLIPQHHPLPANPLRPNLPTPLPQTTISLPQSVLPSEVGPDPSTRPSGIASSSARTSLSSSSSSSLPSSSLPSASPVALSVGNGNPATCASCQSPSPKYTCPRCARKTCSAPCSKSHKDRYGCTGLRDPTKYVPLKDFGQGDWAGDYTWLESGRRKLMSWGEELGSMEGTSSSSRPAAGEGAGGQRRGRDNHAAAAAAAVVIGGLDKHGKPKSKVEIMRRQLLYKGYYVEIMSSGMDRREKNQSSWNQK